MTGLNVVYKICVPVAIILTNLTLKWRLTDDVLDVVKNDGVVVRVTKRLVIMIVRH